jgi:hypothetical protein
MDNRFIYKYEFKYGTEKPKNNATHISVGLSKKYSTNPDFLWQSTGETNSRGQTKWKRATGIQLTPEYKAFLKALKQQKKNKSEYKKLIDSQMNDLALSLGTLGISKQDLAQQFSNITKNTNISSQSSNINMSGGKTFKHRRHTKRHRHTRKTLKINK